jgi:subtilisin family serine protease
VSAERVDGRADRRRYRRGRHRRLRNIRPRANPTANDYDFVNGARRDDDDGQGTHVAGIAAAVATTKSGCGKPDSIRSVGGNRSS